MNQVRLIAFYDYSMCVYTFLQKWWNFLLNIQFLLNKKVNECLNCDGIHNNNFVCSDIQNFQIEAPISGEKMTRTLSMSTIWLIHAPLLCHGKPWSRDSLLWLLNPRLVIILRRPPNGNFTDPLNMHRPLPILNNFSFQTNHKSR